MLKNKKIVLLWLIIYILICFYGFFVSSFALIISHPELFNSLFSFSWNSYRGLNYFTLINWLTLGLPIIFFITPFMAWSFYKQSKFKLVWLCAPGIAILYGLVLFLTYHFGSHSH